jgi:hypothetical protein
MELSAAEFKAELQKRLGADLFGEMQKRFSAAHKAGIMNVARYIDKAMGSHSKGMVQHSKAIKAHGDAIESLSKACDAIGKAKASFGKAAVASDSRQTVNAEVGDHLETVSKALGDMAENYMKAIGLAHKAATGDFTDVDDQQQLAKGAIMKVTGSWVGQPSTAPGASGPGYDPARSGSDAKPTAQSTMTEGEVPLYDPVSPYPKTAMAGDGQVTEAEAKLREENAVLKARLEQIGNLPRDNPKGRLFTPGTAASGGGAGSGESPDSARALVAKLKEAGRISDYELAHMDDESVAGAEIRKNLAARVMGLQTVLHDPELVNPALRDPSYARSLFHPAMKGDPAALAKRATAGNPGAVAGAGGAGVWK